MPAHTVRPDIPVLILSWNTQAFTLRCIDSIADGLDDDTRVQEVVVENGSREALGYSAAVNQAYRRATGELVLLLNIDIVFGGVLGVEPAAAPVEAREIPGAAR